MVSRKPTTSRKLPLPGVVTPADATPPSSADTSRARRTTRARSASGASAKRGPQPVRDSMAIAGRDERWRDAARILIVTVGVALLLLVANRSMFGVVVVTSLDWGAYLAPPLLVVMGLDLLRRVDGGRPFLRFEEVNGLIALFLGALTAFGARQHGGLIGNAIAGELSLYFGALGIPVATAFLVALGLVLALHLTTRQVWTSLRTGAVFMPRIAGGFWRGFRPVPQLMWRHRPRLRRYAGRRAPPIIEAEVLSISTVPAAPEPPAPPVTPPPVARAARARTAKAPVQAAAPEMFQEPALAEAAPFLDPQWPQPPLDLLDPVPVQLDKGPVDNSARMRLIEETLASFNVSARVVGAHSGPAVTRFDVQPERGVRVSRITALQNDLALALAARTIRIQAPVPGQSVVGVELPNAKTSLVTLREVMESDTCARMASSLKIALGKDVSGSAVVADLARMPHLLIAGATGAGKSVLLNSLISCLLFHNSPEQLRLLMVDPKMVELSVFNGVPHLLTPVVTDVTKVPAMLKWAIKEMHRRYKLFAACGARNLARYNELQTDAKKRESFIVIIIDELADLMMVSPEDVEDGICRLAQLARATGMHLVVATQRPSVDVITGLIKANFPARIAFAVSSMVDSRTILDQPGAEKLLGRGDMLYQPPDEGKPIRVQGPYLSEREIEDLVTFWKTGPTREVERIPDAELEASAKEEQADGDDKLMNDAIRVLREYRRASVSLLQRRLSIGYTRAARLLDVLEERGVVGPSEDGRSRVVLDPGIEAEEVPPSGEPDDDQAPPL
ncbi:MAG TPA: DNA translocase FtsK [Chloroflexota bacterium]|nr:DNA translocase FtsK [Chloroflexota bacterium]